MIKDLEQREAKESRVRNFCKSNVPEYNVKEYVLDMSDKELDEWISFINFMERGDNK